VWIAPTKLRKGKEQLAKGCGERLVGLSFVKEKGKDHVGKMRERTRCEMREAQSVLNDHET